MGRNSRFNSTVENRGNPSFLRRWESTPVLRPFMLKYATAGPKERERLRKAFRLELDRKCKEHNRDAHGRKRKGDDLIKEKQSSGSEQVEDKAKDHQAGSPRGPICKLKPDDSGLRGLSKDELKGVGANNDSTVKRSLRPRPRAREADQTDKPFR